MAISARDQQVLRKDQGWQVLGTETPVSPWDEYLKEEPGEGGRNFSFTWEWKLLEDGQQVTGSDGHLKKTPVALMCQSACSDSGHREMQEELQLGKHNLVSSHGRGKHPVICNVL